MAQEPAARPLVTDKAVNAAMAALRTLLRDRVDERDFPSGELRSFFVGLSNESDRALAIVSFSYIDEKIKQLMSQQFFTGVQGPI